MGMNKYRRINVEKEKNDVPENEIRVTARGRTTQYVTYAAKLFNEKNMENSTIKATGTALATAVTIAEIIKRRYKGLHQITRIGATLITDEYEPLEEGLDPVQDVRQVSFIEIELSKKKLNTKDKGYQPPLPESQVQEFSPEEMARGRGGRRKGRGRGSQSSGRSGSSSPPRRNKGRKGKGKGKAKGKGKGKGSKGRDGGLSKGRGKSSKGGKKGKGKGKGGKGGGYDDGYGSEKGKGKGKG